MAHEISAKQNVAVVSAFIMAVLYWLFDHFIYEWLVDFIHEKFGIDQARVIASVSNYVVPFLVALIFFTLVTKAMSRRQTASQFVSSPDGHRADKMQTTSGGREGASVPFNVIDYSDGTSDVQGFITFDRHKIKIQLPRFEQPPKLSFFPDAHCDQTNEPDLIEPAAVDGFVASVQSIPANGPYAKWKWQAHGKLMRQPGK